MKVTTAILCSMLTFAFALGSFAGEFPPLTDSHSLIFGGSINFSKAGLDTINLMAATHDPTNEPGEPYYDGDFEDADGDPHWNGWTHRDLTLQTETHWNISNYNQPSADNHAAWCGDIGIESCGGGDPAGGYGNNWHDLMEFRTTVPHPGSMATVTVSATLIHDSEPGFDFTFLSYRYHGESIADMQSWDGADTLQVNESVTYLPHQYLDDTDIAVYFRFKSDSSYSDADCLFSSAGGCQVDDINVRLINGTVTEDFFEDFEHGGDPGEFGIWNIAFPDGVGDFAQIWTGLADADPCATNHSPQVAFIDDGVVVPGTGGSECLHWCYGPDGYILNSTGGLAGPSEHLHNAVESPVMDWPNPNGGSGPDFDGIILAFDAYAHEDLTADSPIVVFDWYVRSADTDGSAGNGIQDITQQVWRKRGGGNYTGGPVYGRHQGDISDLMNPGRDEIQVQLAIMELGWIWNFNGNDGTPAPYFDNVTVKIFPYQGPSMVTYGIYLAQDDFPDRGSIDYGDLGSHSVRFDMAGVISPPEHPHYDPGDTIVITVAPVRRGAGFDGDPLMHYQLLPNSVFDPFRTSGWPNQGVVTGQPAIGTSGIPAPDKWAFDLPDTAFFFPGDVIHYFFSATDALGGEGGTDPLTSLLPPDTTGFSTGFGDPMGYHPDFTVRALPSIRDDGFGGYLQPPILFINDNGHRGGENEWYTALNNIGLRVAEDYDVYYANSPGSYNPNGIGGRATSILLADYEDILYTSGNQAHFTLSSGEFGNDVGTIQDWLDSGGKDIFLTGDGLASHLSQADSESLNFLENYLGLTVVTDNVRDFIDNQTTPLVKVIEGNPVFSGPLHSWIAFGGCFRLNAFDGVTAAAGGQRLAEFTDPAGQSGQYSYSAATLNILNPDFYPSRIISMPVDLMYIHTDPHAEGNDLSGRALLLRDVLQYFNIVGDPLDVSPVLSGIFFQTSNYPNPFNPSTTIRYSLPRAGHLKLSVFDVGGRLIKTLIDGRRPAGADQAIVWDGTSNDGSKVAAGVYFCEARTGGEIRVQKMALIK